MLCVGKACLEALRELLLVVELPEVERIWLKHDFGCVLFEVFSLTDNSESCLSSCYATLAFPIVPGLCHDAGPRASPLRFRSGTARAWGWEEAIGNGLTSCFYFHLIRCCQANAAMK